MSNITQAITQTNNEYSAALAARKGSGDSMDKQSFLMLLVTQFKYQDPLNPMEDQEFVAQLAQFSSLEQLMNLNTGMESLTNATNNQQMINATSYIGKQVTVAGNTIGKTTDGATGVSSISAFRYAFGSPVAKGTLSVVDGNGNVVYSEDISGKAAGDTFTFNWSGLTSKGTAAPDGTYTVSLAAYNTDGEAVLSDQVVDARVVGVVKQDGTVYLGLDGGQMMELAKVRQVAESSKTTTAKPAAEAAGGNGQHTTTNG